MNTVGTLLTYQKKHYKEMDYATQPVCNIRDVFLLSSLVTSELHGRWFRGGSISDVSPSSLKRFKTIVNFCAEPDDSSVLPGTTFYHIPYVDQIDISTPVTALDSSYNPVFSQCRASTILSLLCWKGPNWRCCSGIANVTWSTYRHNCSRLQQQRRNNLCN